MQLLAAPPTDRTLQPGTYRLQGPGGTDVGAFDPVSTIVPAFDWTNRNTITAVNRSQGLTINWTGGSPGWVEITGFSGNYISGGISESNPDPVHGRCWVCLHRERFRRHLHRAELDPATTPASNDRFRLIQPQPAWEHSLCSQSAMAVEGTFTAPLTAGGTIDYGIFTYAFGTPSS